MKKNITSQYANKYAKEDTTMIIMDLRMDNFLAFRDFHINMAYPKKIVNSYIPNECLKDRKNFRYKKVNILMGGNATGKTSIGRMLMAICNFMKRKDSVGLIEKIANPKKDARLSVDFVGKGFKMYRLDILVNLKGNQESLPEILVCKREVMIEERDRYETCAEKIEQQPLVYNDDFKKELQDIEPIGWMFKFPSDTGNDTVNFPEGKEFVEVLNYCLKSLDPSIINVSQSGEVKDTYIIHMNSGDLLVQNGEVIRKNILSSGTKAGIDIACLIYSIYKGEYGFYYCDEKFSYIHSELEKAFLTIMINGLRDNEQLFFTTHNSDILDLPFPKHTFTFLKKEMCGDEQVIKCVYASDYLKRSTDSIHRAVDNDLFSTAPNIELIYEIADIDGFSKEKG